VAPKLPSLLVWGRQDGVVPLAAGELYRSALKASKLIVLEQCGHRPEVEKSSEFIREVENFLE